MFRVENYRGTVFRDSMINISPDFAFLPCKVRMYSFVFLLFQLAFIFFLPSTCSVFFPQALSNSCSKGPATKGPEYKRYSFSSIWLFLRRKSQETRFEPLHVFDWVMDPCSLHNHGSGSNISHKFLSEAQKYIFFNFL